jgi:glyoxylase-like metal-dependent hydrolase (beta-lactamase superfamily II)
VVSDGPAHDPNGVATLFPEADPEQVNSYRTKCFLPIDSCTHAQNALIVNTGRDLVLIDTGMGASTLMGPDTGRLLRNMRASGIDPAQIDLVLLTHAHPDHAFGLVDDEGNKNFPKAGVVLSELDFKYWTDESKLSDSDVTGLIVAGIRKNVLPYEDQLIMPKDGKEVLPGIAAVATPGHTYGHYIYVIQSDGKLLANVGDLCHDYVGELAHPEWKFLYDMDPDKAIKTRMQMFEQIAKEEMSILGYHAPWPGYGHLRPEKTGYTYIPIPQSL